MTNEIMPSTERSITFCATECKSEILCLNIYTTICATMHAQPYIDLDLKEDNQLLNLSLVVNVNAHINGPTDHFA